MNRVYNFSAGPAVLPEEVLRSAAAEMLDYQGSGMSVMEMSHRSKTYQNIIDEAEADLRDLMNIPDNYKVLFLQGGASQQFAMIPMNLMKNKVADYVITGQWAKKAWQEAQKYGKANAVASSADATFLSICFAKSSVNASSFLKRFAAAEHFASLTTDFTFIAVSLIADIYLNAAGRISLLIISSIVSTSILRTWQYFSSLISQ